MSLNFCAIDFETASWDKASACQIGLVKVINGKITDRFSSLIKPAPNHDWFSDKAIDIHGITPDMVEYAPTWQDLFPAFRSFIDGHPLVAHNAMFDGKVLASICHAAGITPDRWNVGCTLQWSRAILDLDNYKLPTVSKALHIPLHNHHDATADAQACANITTTLAKYVHAKDLKTLARKTGEPIKNFYPDWEVVNQRKQAQDYELQRAQRILEQGIKTEQLKTKTEELVTKLGHTIDTLDGQRVSICGDLNLSFEETKAAVIDAGGKLFTRLAKTTTVLVVGKQKLAMVKSKGSYASTVETALERIEAGEPIRIINAETFYQLLPKDTKEQVHPHTPTPAQPQAAITPPTEPIMPVTPSASPLMEAQSAKQSQPTPPHPPPVVQVDIPLHTIQPAANPARFGHPWADWRQKRNTYAAFAMRVFVWAFTAGALLASCTYPFMRG